MYKTKGCKVVTSSYFESVHLILVLAPSLQLFKKMFLTNSEDQLCPKAFICRIVK